MDKRRVIYAKEGKESSFLSALKDHLESRECPQEQIQNICMDMSPSFLSGALSNFPEAHITFDKFHITKILNEAIDTFRKYERKQHNELKGYRYLFLRKSNHLSSAELSTRSYFVEMYETLGQSYRLKELFNDLRYFSSSEEAGGYLAYWCDIAEDSTIYEGCHNNKSTLVRNY